MGRDWPADAKNRVDRAEVTSALDRLAPSPHPFETFSRLAALLTPFAADRITVDLYTGARLDRWHPHSAVVARVPTRQPADHAITSPSPAGGWTATVHIPGTIQAPAPDGGQTTVPYVVALRCEWAGSAPTEADVIILEAAGRSAARLAQRQTGAPEWPSG